jgi:Zn-dependent protease
MSKSSQGCIRLFKLLNQRMHLHWSWFILAVYEIQDRTSKYIPSLECAGISGLVLIVLLHEFRHALACRQTGGEAKEIKLWPLGGIAYVSPPERPGATLWSIAAGPLVNVILFPVLGIIVLAGRAAHWDASMPSADAFFFSLWIINLVLLVFNLLPIYPLDGGQILRSLLWFLVGKSKSLMIAALVGFFGVGGLLLLAIWVQSFWFAVLAVFALIHCWSALKHARLWLRMAKAPRREGVACPHCKAQPPQGAFWICSNCRNYFDTFATEAACPHCRTPFFVTSCPECSGTAPISTWSSPASL